MEEILVVVGATTSASRLAKRLFKYGDKRARVISTPSVLGGGSCSYSVIASEDSLEYIKHNLRGISIKGIFKKGIAGDYYALS